MHLPASVVGTLQIVTLAQMQETMNTELSGQQHTLARTLDNTRDANDNIGKGNEQVKKATSSSSSMRLGCVFFFLMCSFCLLFLEFVGRR
jgi:t-SNARE complex subunit (syntaxin)